MYKGLVVSEGSLKLVFLVFLGFGAVLVSSPVIFESFRTEDTSLVLHQMVNKKSVAAAFFGISTSAILENEGSKTASSFEIDSSALKGFIFLPSSTSGEAQKKP